MSDNSSRIDWRGPGGGFESRISARKAGEEEILQAPEIRAKSWERWWPLMILENNHVKTKSDSHRLTMVEAIQEDPHRGHGREMPGLWASGESGLQLLSTLRYANQGADFRKTKRCFLFGCPPAVWKHSEKYVVMLIGSDSYLVDYRIALPLAATQSS